MVQTDEKTTPHTDSGADEDLRKRLLQRVALAAGVVVILLGGLVYFDSTVVRNEPGREEVAKVEAPPRPIEKTGEEQAAGDKTSEEKLAGDKVAEAPAGESAPAEAVAEKPGAAATEKPAPVAVAPEPEAEPEVTEAPRTAPRAERPLTVPARPQQAMVRSGEPTVAAQKRESAKEATAAPVARIATPPAPASRPIASAVATTRQFLVQAGVFNNLANAEELRAKIEAAGVPARIEARVQVGPFASRQEAEQAREKLKALGLDPGLIMAARK